MKGTTVYALGLALCLSSALGAAERITTYAYTPQGLVATIDGPRTDVSDITTFTYHPGTNNRATMTNALGQVTEYTNYDGAGRLLRQVDPNGLVTQYTYHSRGWLLTQTVGDGAEARTTQYDYDPAGHLTEITLPAGDTLSYAYDDAGRLTAITDSLGNSQHYTLDAMGNRTVEATQDPTSAITRTLERVYNDLNRLVAVRTPVDGTTQETAYDYDANGNQIGVSDALSRASAAGYDALDRLIAQVDPKAGQTDYAYDARDNLTQVTDPNGHATVYTYDAFDEKISQVSPDTGETTYSYDTAGNLTSRTDARGVTTTYTYDALNRLTRISYPDSALDVRFQYDQGTNGIGQLTQMSDGAGITDYAYDIDGHLISQNRTAEGVTTTIGYAYDGNDRLATLTYPSGRQVHYDYDPSGVVSVTLEDLDGDTQVMAEPIARLPFGPIKALTYGNGLTLTRQYDLDYRLLDQQMPGILAADYGFDAVGNLTEWFDTLDAARDQGFGYDELDRLLSASGPFGQFDYSYDANGNRLSFGDGVTTDLYTYAIDSNRLLEITGGQSESRTYDAAGATTAMATGQFTYDDTHRVVEYEAPGVSATYAYNGQGERVRKIVNGAVTRFRYGPGGQLLGEYDAGGTPIREYVYLDGEPLAILSAGDTIGGEAVDRIIDNPAATQTGEWTASTAISGYLGAEYLYHAPGFDTSAQRVVDNGDAGFSTTGDGWSPSTSVSGYNGADYQYHSANDGTVGGTPTDESDAAVIMTGEWQPSQAIGGYLGTGYHYHTAGIGENAVTWPLAPATAGTYRVFARWTSHPNRASNAQYRVQHANGETVVTLDQRQGGGQWQPLGTFALDSNSQVVLTDAADGYVIADAVLVTPEHPVPNTATWQIGVTQPGSYRVFARWTSHSNRASNATYRVQHAAGETPITVDQRQGGGQWQLLGTFDLGADSHVVLTDEADGYVIADALMTEPVDAVAQPFEVTWPLNAATGEYEVFARWTSHPNRASKATYTVTHQAGETAIMVDQRQDGGTWQSLGHFTLDALSQVSINTNADGYVIADAVRLVGTTAGNNLPGTYYAHTDHLGAIVKVTDQDQTLVWDADRRPFGALDLLTNDIEMPLRFPGQYFDSESGLYYNYFRDYDPNTGRYIQSDPIGLQGGLNTYAYVGANPLRHIDPKGLFDLDIPGATGETSVHANPGPDVTDFRPEHEPHHVHLGSNDGPRVRTDTFEPYSAEDARRLSRSQKRFCKKLTEQQKHLIRTRQIGVYRYGKVLGAIMAAPSFTLDSVTASCKQDPIFCIENFSHILDAYENRCGMKCE